jgi:CubicO group peptidase (beta-lactamase class C family)
VGLDGMVAWNSASNRRQGFRNLHLLHRRGMTFRSENVLPLVAEPDQTLANDPALHTLVSLPSFCGLALVQGNRLVCERVAPDFGSQVPHSIQSITKTLVHLMMGRLVDEGHVDPRDRVSRHVPDVGLAYAGCSLQDTLDMRVSNTFTDDYNAPYAPAPAPGQPVGYARQEIAMGWRLPPPGEAEFGVRDFVRTLRPTASPGPDDAMLYKSTNTDVLGWVIERASGRSLVSHIAAIMNAAGLEHAFHISLDCAGVPVLSGGGVMTIRDLARYGLLLARGGRGLNGTQVGSPSFTTAAQRGGGTLYRTTPRRLTYKNHLVNGTGWIGHPGYAGQFLMASPEKDAALAIFSVLETPEGDQDGYFDGLIAAADSLLQRLPSTPKSSS